MGFDVLDDIIKITFEQKKKKSLTDKKLTEL